MNFDLKFNISESIYLKDPSSSEKGKLIVSNAINLIYELGFEDFTFKKLGNEINVTEATIYRYFENKHKLLLYINNWYWYYLEFIVVFNLQNILDPKAKLEAIIKLLSHELPENNVISEYNLKHLYQIVICESSKSFLVKNVCEINKEHAFGAYKELNSKISEAIIAYNPKYKYPNSLSSTMIEMSHFQQYFSDNLPNLTDIVKQKKEEYVYHYLNDMVFKILS